MTRSNPPDPRLRIRAIADELTGIRGFLPNGHRVSDYGHDLLIALDAGVPSVVPDPTPEPPEGWTKRTEYRTQGYGTLTSNGAMGHTGLIGDIDFRQEQRTVHEGPWGAWPAVTTDPETTEER